MELGFETDRLKTGTPARVDSRSVDFSGLERQPGDEDVRWFSFDPEVRVTPWLGVAAPLKASQKSPGTASWRSDHNPHHAV